VPPTPVAACCVAGEGAHVGDVAKFMAFPTLGEDGGVAKADELASFSKHPYTFLPCLFGDFTRVVHICEIHTVAYSPRLWGAQA
jgi:hypothetical protein